MVVVTVLFELTADENDGGLIFVSLTGLGDQRGLDLLVSGRLNYKRGFNSVGLR